MPIALQATRRQGHDDDWTLEESRVHQTVLAIGSQTVFDICTGCRAFDAVGKSRCASRAVAENANPVDSFKPSDLLGGVQSIHHGQLDVHEDQMKPTLTPLGDCFFSVHSSMPSHLETFHESFQELQIYDVVLNDQNIDGWNGSV